MKRVKTLKTSQTGIVSIVVTIIIMLVLTLIVVGFATLSRREQKQSFDRQLNTQAFYAAESAVNDVRQVIENNQVDLSVDYTSNCNGFISSTTPVLTPSIGNNAQYSCLLVDPSPTDLLYNPVNTANSQVFPVRSKSGEAISRITFQWQAADNTGHNQASCPSVDTSTWANAFPASWPADCKIGILRLDLVPYNGAQLRTNLVNNNMTAFLYPRNAGTGNLSYSTSIGATGTGVISPAICTAQGLCTLTITNVNSVNSYVRMLSIYRNNTVQVTAYNAGGAQLELAGAQAIVDSTGKAVDVLRRIQVRLDITGIGGNFPEYALQTAEGICKRYAVAPPSTVIIQPGGDTTACELD